MKNSNFLLALCVLLLLTALVYRVHAQTQTPDVAPYQIATVNGIVVYKTVYQGCELFIATGSAWKEADSAAITTGRCK